MSRYINPIMAVLGVVAVLMWKQETQLVAQFMVRVATFIQSHLRFG